MIVDRLEAMSVFVEVVEAGSLSAAGRKLGMPLATVSRKLSELEAHVGARLLTRSTRKLTLTDAGRTYLAACERILLDVEQAERAAAGEYSAPRGDLVITAPIVFGRLHVLPVVDEFLAAYPDVDVRLVLGDRVLDLYEEHVDAALRVGELPDSNLIASRIGSIRRVVCASPAYLESRPALVHPRDLSQHACVTFTGLTLPHVWTFTVSGARVDVAIHSRLVVNTAEAAIDAAIAGVGVTCVLSYQVAGTIRAGLLAPVLTSFEPEPAPVHLLYTGQRLLPLKLRAFVDFATPRLRSALAD
jgi:DNA-binding transcriptional LysR family regulator